MDFTKAIKALEQKAERQARALHDTEEMISALQRCIIPPPQEGVRNAPKLTK